MRLAILSLLFSAAFSLRRAAIAAFSVLISPFSAATFLLVSTPLRPHKQPGVRIETASCYQNEPLGLAPTTWAGKIIAPSFPLV